MALRRGRGPLISLSYLNNYNHTKILDARGIETIGGQWVDVNFEFKLKSSGNMMPFRELCNILNEFFA